MRVAEKKNFSKTQTLAFQIFDKELSVLAGAGSGKTSVLVERFLTAVIEKGVSPSRILAITFTEKAANQMKSRLVEACRERGLHDFRREIENASISTIHSFCARLLRENPIESGLDPFFRVLGQGEADILAGKILEALFEEEAANDHWMRILSQAGEEACRGSIRGIYDLYRATGGDESIFQIAGTEEEKNRKKEFVKIARHFQAVFDDQKRCLSSYDFDDLLFLATKLLSGKTPGLAAVRERYQKLFSMVLVDEYQDVSPLQDGLIHLLKSRGNLFIVGDIQQAIYGFRHADPAVFKRRIHAHRGHPAAQNLVLSENYRSRPEILGFVNHFFGAIFPSTDFFSLEAGKRFSAAPAAVVELLCLARDKREEEADADTMRVREARRLAVWIRDLVASGFTVEEEGKHRPVRYGDIAILFRAASPSRFCEKELAEMNIPYEVVKGKGFYEKPEIHDLMGILKLIENPEDDIALAGVLRSPLVGVSDDALYWLSRRAKASSSGEPLSRGLDETQKIEELSSQDKKKLKSFQTLLEFLRFGKDTLRLSGILGRVLEESDYEAKLLSRAGGRQRAANVQKFLEAVSGFGDNGIVGVGDFVRFVGTLQERDRFEPEAKLESGARTAVTLSTIHAVKGLEFPVVIVADMGSHRQKKSRGPFLAMPGEGVGQRMKDPDTLKIREDEVYKRIQKRLSESEDAEEWRLLYVAMTRAKERLLLSGSVSLNASAKGGSAFGGKDGAIKKDGTWMNRLCTALNFHPNSTPGVELGLEFHGVKMGLVPPLIPERSGLIAREEESPAPAWSPDFGKTLLARINTQFKSYEEMKDRTVTDLLMASTVKKGVKACVEEKESEITRNNEELVTPANEFGTVFHRLMEHVVFKKPAKLSRAGIFSRVALPLSAAEKNILWKQASNFWNGPWGKQIRRAERVYPELPFIYKTRRGLLKGQIDLVLRTREGDWVLLDYKTGKMNRAEKDSKAEEFRFQLELYALVFRKLQGEAPVKGSLYFSSVDETVDFNFSKGDFERFEQKLESILSESA